MRSLYRALLFLYPQAFRARYAAEMFRAYSDRRLDARRAGAWTLLRFDAAAIRDLLINAAAEAAHDRQPSFASATQDARFAVRMLWRRPGLSLFSAATLALGIGALTAVVSLVDAVLLEPLPFPKPEQIVAISGVVDRQPAGLSYENLRDLGEQSTTLSAVTPFFAQSVNLTGVAEPDRLRGGFVTAGFFDVTGVAPALGVTFPRDADIHGRERVAVLTDASWKQRFGGRHEIIGEQLLLNNASFTVIGVMPPTFSFPIDEVEVYLPIWATTASIARDSHNYFGIGRLQPHASVAQASAEAAAIAGHLESTYPAINRGRGAAVVPLKDMLVEEAAYSLQLLLAMVGIMLLAACANVAGLQLESMLSRRREIAVRAALGAGPLRLARQLLFESVARGMVGAAAGILAARVALGFLVANAPAGLYGIENVRLNPVVIGVGALAALIAGIIAGLPPALYCVRRLALPDAGSGSRTVGDTGASRLRGVLVIGQVAVATVLLVAAGLTVRSFTRLTSVDVGFDAANLLTMEYRLPRNKYDSPASQAAFHRQVLEQVRALPGIVDAASVRALPFSGNGSTADFRLTRDGEPREASFTAVSDRYFDTMRIPLLEGRVFAASDRQTPVVIISRALADHTWPGERAIGRTLYFDDVAITASVIGVVGDVRHRDLADRNAGTIYASQDQNPGVFNTLAIRTSGPPMVLADAVRRAVWRIDPDQPVWKIRTLDSLIDRSVATRRFLTQLVVFFGASAAALAVLGLYGVVASGVAQRTREIGVRVALGATRRSVLRLVLRKGLRLGALGVASGLGAAILVANALQSFLFGVSSRDPLTYAATAGLLMTAALLACWLPARRALRVDPVDALRQ